MTTSFEERYALEGELGVGAYGRVYRARDRRSGAVVAIKVLLAAADLSRFQREAELVSSLSHPNVVRVLDFGVHEGKPFLVFELAEGRTLERIVEEEGPMPVPRLLAIAAGVLDALAAAHRAGIIHRDIKPANIMIGPNDHVKLLDFGVARSLDADRTSLTQPGEMIGTPAYMSPEQVVCVDVDASSDLYSLGLVLAEALTGQTVYEGPLARVLQRHASPEPVPIPPSVLASPLGRAIARSTMKSPALRFRSAGDMRAALSLAAMAVAPKPVWKRKIGLALAGALLVGVTVFFVLGAAPIVAAITLRLRPPVAPPVSAAEAEKDEVELQARFARAGYSRIFVARASPEFFAVQGTKDGRDVTVNVLTFTVTGMAEQTVVAANALPDRRGHLVGRTAYIVLVRNPADIAAADRDFFRDAEASRP